ncbi:hypothetical protein, partial [Cohaesibacter celericrescens]|uniref:hypothetical protein n=1 Tax=Cohaesibacter celericrescens TaxID=2067669 RepID=UPI00356448BE
LVLISLKASPLVQGRLTSLYAALTYAVAAVVILVSGIATQLTNLTTVTLCVFGLTAGMIFVTLTSAPRLRDLQ